MESFLQILCLILIFLASGGILLSREWKWVIGSLAVLYIGIFGLIAAHWPVYQAVIKLITGWTVCTILAVTRNPEETIVESASRSHQIFTATAAILLMVSVLYLSPQIYLWLPEVSQEQITGGLGLFLLGVFQLGISSKTLRVILGLLVFLAGFDLIFSAVEDSLLVTALLAAINLGMAFVGAYLMSFSPGEAGRELE